MQKETTKPVYISENGFIMPYAVFALAILSILGIMATQNSSMENIIAGNIKAMKINFYSAEGVAIEAARAIENESSQNLRNGILQPPDTTEINIITNADTNSTARVHTAQTLKNPEADIPNYDTLDTHSGFQIVGKGGAEGESLDIGVTESITYKYNIFGVSNAGGTGRKVIEIGYVRTISLTE
jgi:hypothetical protein